MKRLLHTVPGLGGRARGAALVAVLATAGCDLGVTNPRTIADESLDDPRVIPAIAAGAIGQVAVATTGRGAGSSAGLYMGVALLTDELVHSGGSAGFRSLSDGTPADDTPDAEARWANVQSARWTAERAISRIGRLVPDSASNRHVATTSLWAGFANRMLGDNFCQVTFNGGPPRDPKEALKRAEEHFTRAIDIGRAARMDTLVTAALGGRAQTRMMLGNWQGAVADAGQVPIEFGFVIDHSPNTQSWNTIVAFGFDGTRGEATVWGTPFADWGVNFSLPAAQRRGDPRVEFDARTDTLQQYIKGNDDRRPRWRQLKYQVSGDNTPLVRGTEMRLIEAEAALVAGNWQAAVDKINQVRTLWNGFLEDQFDLPMVSASGPTEAWHLLMKERGIEMWLEGRRLGDLRRWSTTPGVPTPPFTVVRKEAAGQPATEDPRVPVTQVPQLCLPVGRTERLTNPNF